MLAVGEGECLGPNPGVRGGTRAQGILCGAMKVVMWWLASQQGSGAGSEVWASSSTEKPALGGFVTALRVLQKSLLFSGLVDVSLFILNCS